MGGGGCSILLWVVVRFAGWLVKLALELRPFSSESTIQWDFMTERWVWLAVALWFGALSRAAFYQTGLIGEGPVVRFLRWGLIPYMIQLATFDVDVEAYGREEGFMRVLNVGLGIAFALVAAIGGAAALGML